MTKTTKTTGTPAPTSNAMTAPTGSPKQTAKRRAKPSAKTPPQKTPNDLYKEATARDAADPRDAMRTAAAVLDLFEKLMIMTEKAAEASPIGAPEARAAFLAFLLRLDAEYKPVGNLQASIDHSILSNATVCHMENVLTWRKPKSGQARKIKIHIDAEL